MAIYQSRIFEKRVKGFSKKEKKILDQEIKRIVGNPSIGQEKKGDLSGVYVYKFKIKTFASSNKSVGNLWNRQVTK